MSVHAGPNSVESGLVLYLDAGNTKSYPGSGTTWSDLSGLNNNGTLTNGPSYSSGYFSFDGVDDYGSIADVTGVTDFSITDNYSIDFWCYINSTQPSTGAPENMVVEKWSETGGYPYVFRYVRSTTSMFTQVYNGTSAVNRTIAISSNTWWHICGVYNFSGSLLTLYGNGGSTSSSTALNLTGTITNDSALNLMRRGNNWAHCAGRLSNLKIYNRALTAQEVQQNFSALRGRYGV